MKTYRLLGLVLLIVLVVALSNVAAQARQLQTLSEEKALDVQDGIVLQMGFEDDPTDGILDSSPYGNHGTCTSCPDLTTDAKVGSYAYKFDRGEYFSLGSTAGSELEPQAMTIAFWVKVLSAIDRDTLVGLCGPDTGDGQAGYIFNYEEEQQAIRFMLGHRPPDSNLNGYHTNVKSGDEIELGTWYHIAGRWDGENIAIFVNGNLSNESWFKNMDAGTNPITYQCGTREFFVATGLYYLEYPHTARHANIIMDDLRMYDRALTNVEIAELACGADGTCSGENRLCPKQAGVCIGSQQSCAGEQWPGCFDADYLAWNSDYEPQELSCMDGLDNDCDGKIDRADSDCALIETSRDVGVAPLAVFFDAINEFTWDEIEQYEFTWDFGDGSQPSTGYMAAHVYELGDDQPATDYTVTLTIEQNGLQVGIDTRVITVSPFSGRTLCASTAGNFTDCPSLVSTDHFTDLGLAWEQVDTNTRLLLRRGENWVSSLSYQKDGIPGPVIVGAYGEGSRPSVMFTSTDPDDVTFYARGSSDWRFVDLDIQGGGAFGGGCSYGIGDCHDLLVLRVHVNGTTTGNLIPGAKKGFFIFDSSFENLLNYLVYNYYGEDLAFINVTAHEADSHFYRIGGHEKLLVQGNHISDPGTGATTHDTLTVRGGGYYSQYILVSGNTFQKPGWLLQFGPQNTESVGPMQYVMVEGNTFAPYPGQATSGVGFILDGYDATIRNNLFVDVAYAIDIGERDQFDDSRRVGIYNNTMYHSPEGWANGFLSMDAEANPQDIRLYNNILSAGAGSYTVIRGDGVDPSVVDSDHNIWDIPGNHTFFGLDLATWQTTYGQDQNSLIVDPQFVSEDASHIDFLKLSPGSPAIDAGTAVPVFDDFAGYGRPQDGDNDGNSRWDIGAYELVPELVLHGMAGDQTIYLTWDVNVTLPTSVTWTISYTGTTGDEPSPIEDITSPTRSYLLTGLTNYEWYEITLTTNPPMLTDTVRIMPTDHLLCLPIVAR